MKSITKTYQVYDYSELSEKAQRRALNKWNDGNDFPMLQSILQDECGELLKEHNIKCTSNFPTVLYSLSNAQGDGLMFEGSFEWEGYEIKISHEGHYYHSHSKSITVTNGDWKSANDEKAFEDIYQSVCKKLEKFGYDLIEEETSEERFIDECNENGYTFLEDGTMLNA